MTSQSSSGSSSTTSLLLTDHHHHAMALDRSMSDVCDVIEKWTRENDTSLLLAMALNSSQEDFDTSKVDQKYFRRSVLLKVFFDAYLR